MSMCIFHILLSQFVGISTFKKKGGSRTKSLKKENENIFSTERKRVDPCVEIE